MSIERDYLMRQLMQLFEVIQKILGHRKKRENDQAEEQIRYFYSCLKVETNIRELTIEELINYLQDERKLSNEHLELLAFVLKEQGELAVNENDKLDYFRKSYFLLDKVERESTSFSMDRQMKLSELREFLN